MAEFHLAASQVAEMSVEELHEQLQRLPRQDWPRAVARLPVEKKRELCRLLSRRHTEKSRASPSSPTASSSSSSSASSLASSPKALHTSEAASEGVCTPEPSDSAAQGSRAREPPSASAGDSQPTCRASGRLQPAVAARERRPESVEPRGRNFVKSERQLSPSAGNKASSSDPASRLAPRSGVCTVHSEKKRKTHPYGLPSLPLSGFLPLLCPPAWGFDLCRSAPAASSTLTPPSSSFSSSSSSSSSSASLCGRRGEEGDSERFAAFRRQLFAGLLQPSSPTATLFRPLEELAFVSGLIERLREESQDPMPSRSIPPPALATRVLAVYLHCWLAAFLHAFHADTVFAYCTCPASEVEDRDGSLGCSSRAGGDAKGKLAFSDNDDEATREPRRRALSGDFFRAPSKCRGCLAVTKRLHGTANWRRFLERYFPVEVARFASVASAHQSAARALASNSSSLASSFFSSSSSSLSSSSSSLSSSSSSLSSASSSLASSSFSLLPLPLRPQYVCVEQPSASELSSATADLSPAERGLRAAEAAQRLLHPERRFEERLELLHVRSRSLGAPAYRRFAEARSRQLLRKTLQALPFRTAFAQLATHVWALPAKPPPVDAVRGEAENEATKKPRTSAAEIPTSGAKEREEDAREGGEDEGRGRVAGVVPAGQITQLFLFIVNDRLQTCAELALRCMYTWREQAQGRSDEARVAGDAQETNALFSSADFRQSPESQRALLSLGAVARGWGLAEPLEAGDGEAPRNATRDKRDEEQGAAVAAAANLLFHCVDQPLFNILGSFPLFSSACAVVDVSSKKKKRRPSYSPSSSPSSASSSSSSSSVSPSSFSSSSPSSRSSSSSPQEQNREQMRSAWFSSVKVEATGAAKEREMGLRESQQAEGGRDSRRNEDEFVGPSRPLSDSLVPANAEETEGSARWSALIDAAIDFCVRREEETSPASSPSSPSSSSSSSSSSSPASSSSRQKETGGRKGRGCKRRRSRSDEEGSEERDAEKEQNEKKAEKGKKEEKEGDKWRLPGIDLCGAFVAVRVQQLWTASQGQGDCREMINQALREWRTAGAALASGSLPDEGKSEDGRGEVCEIQEENDACTQSVKLLLSLHKQLRQMYEHMAAASRMAALLSLLRSSSPRVQQPRFLSMRELLDVNCLLQAQASLLSRNASRFLSRTRKASKRTAKKEEEEEGEEGEREEAD
ncbi:hypothetical protein TGFOU_218800 [Toxoplasma gondii FOU]|uniref:Uncharacterized protein n=1 Tax=Toxoplasma gondii FOU TaxID=943167 RepID=A0A086L2F8_TOXGO|nr:hypothetical protein TGFOU_218800 [Toxoplasma gondii FOU]